MEDIRHKFDKTEKSILILIDFSNAFDTVSHSILLQKLKDYFGFSKYSCDLIRSYLSLRTQAVINNKNTYSVKQIYLDRFSLVCLLMTLFAAVNFQKYIYTLMMFRFIIESIF